MKVLLAVIFCVAVFCGVEALKCYDCHRCPRVNAKTPTTECNGECVTFQTQENDGSLANHRHCETLEQGDADGCSAVDREFDKPVVKCEACKTNLCNNGAL